MLSEHEFLEHGDGLDLVVRRALNLLIVFTMTAFLLYGMAVYLWWSGWNVLPIIVATATFLGFRLLRPRVLFLSLRVITSEPEKRAIESIFRRELPNHNPDILLRELHRQVLERQSGPPSQHE